MWSWSVVFLYTPLPLDSVSTGHDLCGCRIWCWRPVIGRRKVLHSLSRVSTKCWWPPWTFRCNNCLAVSQMITLPSKSRRRIVRPTLLLPGTIYASGCVEYRSTYIQAFVTCTKPKPAVSYSPICCASTLAYIQSFPLPWWCRHILAL